MRTGGAVSDELPSASLVENVRFNALVIVPNAVQGIFRRRRPAGRGGDPGRTSTARRSACSRAWPRTYEGGPVWVRVVNDEALLLLDPADVERVLEGSPAAVRLRPQAEARRHGRLPARRADDLAGRALAQPAPVHRRGARERRAAGRQAAEALGAICARGGRAACSPARSPSPAASSTGTPSTRWSSGSPGG